jgi:hypothetical protein
MTAYHLTLNGQGYLIDLASYRKQAGVPFAGKVAAGNRVYADLKDVAVWAQTDWRGGRGFRRWSDATPDRWQAGSGLDTLGEGQVQSGPAAQPIAAWAPNPAVATIRGFVTYRSGLFWATAAGGTLRLYRAETEGGAPAVWATAGPTAAGGLAAYKDAVWLGAGSDGRLYRFDASLGTFTLATTLPGTPLGIPALAVYVPGGTTRLLYLGVNYDAGAQVYAWDGTTATSLITLEGASIEHVFSFDGRLYVAAADAGGNGLLYRYNGTDWALVATLAENWVQSGAAFGEHYYLGSGRDNRVWRFNGRDLVEVLAGYGPHGSRVRALLAFGGRLYAGLAWSDNFRTLVASPDGAAWHELRPSGLTPREAGGLGVRHLGALGGSLYAAEELSGGSGAQVYRIALGTAYNPSGTVESARYDAGLPSIDKVWRRAIVTHAPLAAGESVGLAYRLDGAAGWTELLANSTAGATTSQATFPDGTLGREIEVRLTLTSPGGSTATVKSVLVEYALAPDVRREWEFDVLLEGTPRVPLVRLDGTREPLTGAELAAALWAARGAKATLPFVDLDGASYRVYCVDLREQVAPLPHRDGWQTRARVRLVEA